MADPDRYGPYFEKLCPRLTDLEVSRSSDQIRADPKWVVGVVFAASGSARATALQLLQDALKASPDDPLLLYAALSSFPPGMDRLDLARRLATITPQDASPLYAAALEALNRGDREAAAGYLIDATKRERGSSLYASAIEATIDAYQRAGRSEDDARTRIYLEGILPYEAVTTSLLERRWLDDGFFEGVARNPAVAASLLYAYQKIMETPGLDLQSYNVARGGEISFLMAFLDARMRAPDGATYESYFATPISEMLEAARSEEQNSYPLIQFADEKAGVYQRLSSEEKIELISRIRRDGDVAAFTWVYQVRPDVFMSPDFKPSGVSMKMWSEMLAAGTMKNRLTEPLRSSPSK